MGFREPGICKMQGFADRINRATLPKKRLLFASLDDPRRRREPFDGANSLLEPPSKFGIPVLELAVDAEIMRPVLRDIGIELGLPADRDQVGLSFLQDGFGLLALRE